MKKNKQIVKLLLPLCLLLTAFGVSAQTDRVCYIKHYSNYYLSPGTNQVQLLSKDNTKQYHILQTGRNTSYYYIYYQDGSTKYYLVQSGDGLVFQTSNSGNAAQFSLENAECGYSLIKNRGNSQYVAAEKSTNKSTIFCNGNGSNSRNLWLLTEDPDAMAETLTDKYLINPEATRQTNEGWGVSLCWWANMCGKWSDAKIDEIVDWLVSPTGLNYNIFRYNIGGGDAPGHTHMRDGKGIRAEMEGFKDSSSGDYIWSRDAAQRKIMLKIKQRKPDAIFEAFSNSAPYYMTTSGCSAGNSYSFFGAQISTENLPSKNYEEFAHYLVDVCMHYKDEYGIEFRTLEPFNEPNTNYWKKNGDQEGCKFEPSSQVAFIKKLYPILQASGLKTVISVADETSVADAITGFNAFKNGGVLDMIGQFNTHTYDATIKNRTQLNALVRDTGKKLWMSESGASGDGIKGNLTMAKRLFDDVRYLESDAWVDWQYVEEWNDQWCLVSGNFADQTYKKVKNYYVRQQITRYIHPGYKFLATADDLTLAAINQTQDTIVLVALNPDRVKHDHEVRLLNCSPSSPPYGTITSATSDGSKSVPKFKNGVLTFSLPDLSIATYIIPITHKLPFATEEVRDGACYIIQPQYNREVALTSENGGLTIQPLEINPEWEPVARPGNTAPVAHNQAWMAHRQADGSYTLTTVDGEVLHGNSGYYLQTTPGTPAADQTTGFTFNPVSNHSYQITLVGSTRALDLDGEKTDAGTRVGIYEVGTDPAQCHRNWQLTSLELSNPTTDIEAVEELPLTITPGRTMLEISGDSQESYTVMAYTLGGALAASTDFAGSVSLPLATGCYVVSVTSPSGTISRTVLVK